MPLEHVSMWHSQYNSWKRISIEEANKYYSLYVSPREHLFMCDLCFQYVAFMTGGKNVSHFKHNKSDQDKECDERAQALKRDEHEILRSTIPNPMRIKVEANSICIEVGFLPMPIDVLERAEGLRLQACILSQGKTLLIKNIDKSNFSTESTVFHSIGNCFEEQFQISIIPAGSNIYLPLLNREFSGLNSPGTLFDTQTGKKIPIDGDIEIGRKYYLLTKMYVGGPSDIDITRILSDKAYNLYALVISKVTKITTEFFLRYRCRLTTAPTKLTPIWPIVHEGDHYIETNRQKLYFLLNGDSSVKIEPQYLFNAMDIQKPNDKNRFQLICLNNVSRLRMLWAARLSVLRYLSLHYNPLSASLYKHIQEQNVVYTNDQSSLNSGIYHSLPKKNRLFVVSKYDGKIVRTRNSEVIWSKRIKAGVIEPIEQVYYDEDIYVFHGLDEVISISFQRRKKQLRNTNDETIFATLSSCRGRYVRCPNRIGWIIAEIGDMPKTRAFVLAAIQEGFIRCDAINVISNMIQRRGLK
jgi:hypothetical protein